MADPILLSDGQTLYNSNVWLTKKEASQKLGIATKTIERWVQKGLLPQETIKPPMQREMSVYHIDDLKRVQEEKQQHPVSVRAEQTPQTQTRQTPQPPSLSRQRQATIPQEYSLLPSVALRHTTGTPTPETAALMSAWVSGWSSSLATIVAEKGTYLPLEKAIELTGWPEPTLRKAVKEGLVRRAPSKKLLLRTVDLLQL